VNDIEQAWWASRTLSKGRTLEAVIGPLRVWMQHSHDAWIVAWQRDDDVHSMRLALSESDAPPPEDNRQRHVLDPETDIVRLQPGLLDRPIVVRTLEPVFLPSGESTTLYISTPLSLSLCVGDNAEPLCEIQTLRLSDSWFGPNTREGKVCYAARTSARTVLAELPRRPNRAISPVHIRNRAPTPLSLEKLSLPVPALGLYADEQHGLWTQSLTLERDDDNDVAALRVGGGAPAEAPNAEAVAEARTPSTRGAAIRAFSRIFRE
jgi:hypothetical protein